MSLVGVRDILYYAYESNDAVEIFDLIILDF